MTTTTMKTPVMGKTAQLGLVGAEQLPLLDEESIPHPPESIVVSFKVYGQPAQQGSMKVTGPKGGFARVVPANQKQLTVWRDRVTNTAAAEMGSVKIAERGAPVRVWLTFVTSKPPSTARKVVRKTTSPDIDKLIRGILDGLTGVCYRDDAQVDELRARKRFCAEGEPEHCSIVIEIGTKP
jgi:crossover junction endodeoxyribonuclease RusA